MATVEEKAQEVSELLNILSNQNRILILCCLINNPLTVNEILKLIPTIKQSSLSQQLSILKANNILSSEKTGQNVKYFIKDKKIILLFEFLKEHYC
ncbi:MAG: ArsR/SmtB family transcription factor [Lachnospirales bacterium]